MAKPPLLLIAAGGTGGHMFPAQALAEAMLALGWRVKLSTDARGARYAGGFPAAVEIEEVSSATFARGGALAKLLVPFRILGGVASAALAMLRDKPADMLARSPKGTVPVLLLPDGRVIDQSIAIMRWKSRSSASCRAGTLRSKPASTCTA